MGLQLKASVIKDAMYEAEIDMDDRDVLRPSYSGRYMYGATCLGIVGGPDTLMRFVSDVIPRIDPGFSADSDVVPRASDEWYELRWDNMAMDMIFYWPGVQVEDDLPTEDEVYSYPPLQDSE